MAEKVCRIVLIRSSIYLNIVLLTDAGIKWRRRLVFRGKLTMHTAYDRRDNASPASVTCVAAARNGRGLAVGDARGRVSRYNIFKKSFLFTEHLSFGFFVFQIVNITS